ncbi:hypothetical protein X975_24193, partial [Stegodyphus mimosarum]
FSEAEEFAWERRNVTSSDVPSLNYMDFNFKTYKTYFCAEWNFE